MYDIEQSKRHKRLFTEVSERVSVLSGDLEEDAGYCDCIISEEFTERGYEIGIARWFGNRDKPTVPKEMRVIITREEIEQILSV